MVQYWGPNLCLVCWEVIVCNFCPSSFRLFQLCSPSHPLPSDQPLTGSDLTFNIIWTVPSGIKIQDQFSVYTSVMSLLTKPSHWLEFLIFQGFVWPVTTDTWTGSCSSCIFKDLLSEWAAKSHISLLVPVLSAHDWPAFRVHCIPPFFFSSCTNLLTRISEACPAA